MVKEGIFKVVFLFITMQSNPPKPVCSRRHGPSEMLIFMSVILINWAELNSVKPN